MTDREETKIIWQGSDGQYVRLEHQEFNGDAKANEHPIVLNPTQLYAALKSLEIYGTDTLSVFADAQERTTPVFTAAELDVLVGQAAAGLQIAEPGEDVVFALVGMHPGAISKERKAVAGRMFYSDGALNIIFGDLHRPVVAASGTDVRGLTRDVDRRLYPYRPGLRSEAIEHRWRIVANNRIRYEHFSDHSRDDWLVLTLTDPPVLRGEHEQRGGITQPAAEAPGTPKSTPAPPVSAHHDPDELHQRLKTLKKLFDDGLINGQEYRAKRQSILNGL